MHPTAAVVFLSAVASSISSHTNKKRQIIFDDEQIGRSIMTSRCLPLDECPKLFEMAKSGNMAGLSEFDRCGFRGSMPKYMCPTSEGRRDYSDCDCKVINDCPEFLKLAKVKNYKELSRQRRCGFQGSNIKLCCPPIRKKATSGGTAVINVGANFGEDDKPFSSSTDKELKEILFEMVGSECGSVGFRPFIFGGNDADPHEYPWAAALEYTTADGSLILCSGALITRMHVLTAAHCLLDTLNLTSVRLGHANLTDPGSLKFPVERTTAHPNFVLDPPNILNDIAVVHLKRPVTISNAIKPVCLPDTVKGDSDADAEDTLLAPNLVTVIGWGRTENEARPDNLQELDINVVDRKRCEDDYILSGADPSFTISERQMCAASPTIGSDSCKGDSGGPLLTQAGNDAAKIVGVVSFGTNKCDSSLPGIYTRVSSYVRWIQSVVFTDRAKLNK